MTSSEFNERKSILYRYFHHPKWKYKGDDGWDYEYYKGKKNIEELENAINIVFSLSEAEIIEKHWFYNNEKRIIGGTIICNIFVSPDFNGINQGSGVGTDFYIAFTLSRFGFFYNQSNDLGALRERIAR